MHEVGLVMEIYFSEIAQHVSLLGADKVRQWPGKQKRIGQPSCLILAKHTVDGLLHDRQQQRHQSDGQIRQHQWCRSGMRLQLSGSRIVPQFSRIVQHRNRTSVGATNSLTMSIGVEHCVDQLVHGLTRRSGDLLLNGCHHHTAFRRCHRRHSSRWKGKQCCDNLIGRRQIELAAVQQLLLGHHRTHNVRRIKPAAVMVDTRGHHERRNQRTANHAQILCRMVPSSQTAHTLVSVAVRLVLVEAIATSYTALLLATTYATRKENDQIPFADPGWSQCDAQQHVGWNERVYIGIHMGQQEHTQPGVRNGQQRHVAQSLEDGLGQQTHAGRHQEANAEQQRANVWTQVDPVLFMEPSRR